MKWYLKVLHQYFDFSGRARRTEFWMFTIINFLFACAAMFIEFGILIYLKTDFLNVFTTAYLLVTYIPSLAVTERRLQDIGKRGW